MSELAVVVKMVDEVVKPLLAIQEALQKTEQELDKAQSKALHASYQLAEVYKGFDKNCKRLAERNADLETLSQHFMEGVSELKKVHKKIDKSVQDGVRGAANDLTEAVNEQLQPYLKSKLDAQIQYLNQSVQYALNTLNDYQAMAWRTHAKMIVIAIVCGTAVGCAAFFGLSYKIKHVFCDCRCPAPVCAAQPSEPALPAASTSPAPQKPVKKSYPTKRYR